MTVLILNKDDIQKIKDSVNILDVVSEYVDLKPKGDGIYYGKCPFHNDINPSFHVYTSTQSFYCYGCGKGDRRTGYGSDVIAFIQEIRGLDFYEACEYLIDRYGIRIESRRPENKMYSLARMFHEQLKHEKKALEFLQARGFDRVTIDKFMLGYSTKYDAIVVPIFDNKDIVGFAFRNFDESKPKWVNSNNFEKAKYLFGLNRASVTKEGFLILVEGFFDCIMLHQKGFTNTVAIMGLHLSDDQLSIIQSITNKVYLWFDGDMAGREGINKTADFLLQNGLNVYIIETPGTDPDEFCKDKEFHEIQSFILSSSQSMILNRINEVLTPIEKMIHEMQHKALSQLLSLVLPVKDDTVRMSYLSYIMKRLDLKVPINEIISKHKEVS